MKSITDSYPGYQCKRYAAMVTNPLVRSDSYKLSHPWMYPEEMNYLFDYVESRSGSRWPSTVFFGLQMFIKQVLMVPFTEDDIVEAEFFYNLHFPPAYKDKIFDVKTMRYILEKYDGIFPVKIKAVPEGTVN